MHPYPPMRPMPESPPRSSPDTSNQSISFTSRHIYVVGGDIPRGGDSRIAPTHLISMVSDGGDMPRTDIRRIALSTVVTHRPTHSCTHKHPPHAYNAKIAIQSSPDTSNQSISFTSRGIYVVGGDIPRGGDSRIAPTHVISIGSGGGNMPRADIPPPTGPHIQTNHDAHVRAIRESPSRPITPTARSKREPPPHDHNREQNHQPKPDRESL